MQGSPLLSLSPSFNSYSSARLAEIAARVVEECALEPDSDFEIFDSETGDVSAEKQVDDGEDDDFEFAFVCREPESSPISADEIFFNGQIRPLYPIFNGNLLLNEDQSEDSKHRKPSPTRLPLRKLMSEDRDPPSSSSSEADELEGVPAGTYCVWTPGSASESSRRSCKKSNSTGSSKRWKFRDLLYRSNSDGKDTFIFLTPKAKTGASSKSREQKVAESNNSPEKMDSIYEKVPGKAGSKRASADDETAPLANKDQHYVKNRAPRVSGKVRVKGDSADGEADETAKLAVEERYTKSASSGGSKEGERRRFFLPYKQDLIGFFSNVNGLSRNVHPF
ncbi:uncharacterized protein LOC131146423 [Malania oleifera]|uniref:uncharacterized protein LOC131146423 n=1 Tax=Malania oleifera TaxID=397392 RepID=UPI0025AECA76|nr:uncharacterized protein LOC131146423 [Malania oleifera]